MRRMGVAHTLMRVSAERLLPPDRAHADLPMPPKSHVDRIGKNSAAEVLVAVHCVEHVNPLPRPTRTRMEDLPCQHH